MECIFCKIIAHEIPSVLVYKDEYTYAFKDINPQMPVHVVVVPKKHIESLEALSCEDAIYAQKLLFACQKVARLMGIEKDGYRVITNIGENGAQTVKHLHFHVLGGEKMGEKII